MGIKLCAVAFILMGLAGLGVTGIPYMGFISALLLLIGGIGILVGF